MVFPVNFHEISSYINLYLEITNPIRSVNGRKEDRRKKEEREEGSGRERGEEGRESELVCKNT